MQGWRMVSCDNVDIINTIPGNDDSRKSIELICSLISKTILKSSNKVDVKKEVIKSTSAKIPTKKEVNQKIKNKKKNK